MEGPGTNARAPYEPRPLDTSQVELPRELDPLLEALAENVHEVWAAGRKGDGWRYGLSRDDVAKETPTMVPYAELPESEKTYDRETATETLRFIVAQGFRIIPRGTPSSEMAGPMRALRGVRDELSASPGISLERAVELWQTRNADLWPEVPELYGLLGTLLLRLGEPLLAHDVLSQARADLELRGGWPHHHQLRHLLGLSLARSGATQQAYQVALDLRTDVPADSPLLEDTLGLVGRTMKDLALLEPERGRRRDHFRNAYDAYRNAFESSHGSYSAINAATMAHLAGLIEESNTLAKGARDRALVELEKERGFGRTGYWQIATLGEAALLLGDIPEARRRYGEAAQQAHARSEFGDLAATRRQAVLILSERGEGDAWLDEVIRIPCVVVFSGHRIDEPGVTTPRFPPEAEETVRRAIRARLASLDAGFGFSAASNGADILFQEEMRARGGKTHVVLPFGRAEFLNSSVLGPATGDWPNRFEAVLRNATDVLEASEQQSMDSGVLFEYAHALLIGAATLQARLVDTHLVPLALWDGKREMVSGGTASAIDAWRRSGREVEVIDLPSIMSVAAE